jgi:hypothetical protein
MAENKKDEGKLVDVDKIEVTELEDQDLDEVSGGLTDTNCGCSVHVD